MIVTQEFGDSPGHPFRGNQYVDGMGGDSAPDRQPWIDQISKSAPTLERNLQHRFATVLTDFQTLSPTMANRIDVTCGHDPTNFVGSGVLAGTRWVDSDGGFAKHGGGGNHRVEIDISPYYGTDAHRMEQDIANAHDDGILAVDRPEGTMWHELAHASLGILNEAGLTKSGIGDPGAMDRESARQIRIETDADPGERSTVREDLSSYALLNTREYIAEAYGQYKTMPDPSPTAVAVGQWLDDKLATYEANHKENAVTSAVQPLEIELGDSPGHPFRGNQYTSGEGGGAEDKQLLAVRANASPDLELRRAYARTIAPELHAKCVAAAETVVPLLKEIVAAVNHGAELVGAPPPFEKFTKTEDSMVKKFAEKSLAQGRTVDEAVARFSDGVRATLVADASRLEEATRTALNSLAQNGFTFQETGPGATIENYFMRGDDYNGINGVLTAPPPLDVKVELQFHTPESLHVKENLTHVDYKIFNDPSVSKEERAAARDRMVATADSIPLPPMSILGIGQPTKHDLQLGLVQSLEMTITAGGPVAEPIYIGVYEQGATKPVTLYALVKEPFGVWMLNRGSKAWEHRDELIKDILPGGSAPDNVYRMTREAFDAQATAFGCPTLPV